MRCCIDRGESGCGSDIFDMSDIHLVAVPQCRLRGNDGPSVHVWRPGVDASGSPISSVVLDFASGGTQLVGVKFDQF